MFLNFISRFDRPSNTQEQFFIFGLVSTYQDLVPLFENSSINTPEASVVGHMS